MGLETAADPRLRPCGRLPAVLALALALLGCVASLPSAAGVYTFDIDAAESEAILTVFGVDFSGAMDGGFLFLVDGEIVHGSADQIVELDATVEDIDMGLAVLEDIQLYNDPARHAMGRIVDPDPDDGFVSLDQYLPVIIDFVYDPLFGDPEPYSVPFEVCVGEVLLCQDPVSDGWAQLQTASLHFSAFVQDTIPAEVSPTGDDIIVTLIMEADTTAGGPAAAPGAGLPAAARLDVWPNPTSGPLFARWAGPETAVARAAVYDPSGRRIADLELRGGAFVWSGRETSGRRSPSGVYFVRLVFGEWETVGRFHLLR